MSEPPIANWSDLTVGHEYVVGDGSDTHTAVYLGDETETDALFLVTGMTVPERFEKNDWTVTPTGSADRQ